MYTLRVKLVDCNAIAPKKGTEGAAGLDLYAAHNLVVKAHGKALLDTGIAIELPIGCYGRIAPRSGASYRNHFLVGAGIIDSDFRGTIKVLIFNISNEDFHIRIGESHTQLILEKIFDPHVEIVKALSRTNREKADLDRYHFTEQLWKSSQD